MWAGKEAAHEHSFELNVAVISSSHAKSISPHDTAFSLSALLTISIIFRWTSSRPKRWRNLHVLHMCYADVGPKSSFHEPKPLLLQDSQVRFVISYITVRNITMAIVHQHTFDKHDVSGVGSTAVFRQLVGITFTGSFILFK